MRRTPPRVTSAQLRDYRSRTYRLKPSLRLKSEADALDFVNQRGFVFFWPIKGVEMPSLWAATAGDRPVADEHDDPGHVTWGWKDKLLGARQWYYAKALRGKSTMISLKTLKYFYALSENYGDPRDFSIQYEEGRMTLEAKLIYEALLENGRLDTLSLRREARLTGKESSTRFERGLVELQRGMRILPVGVAEAGSWNYAFVYDLVDRCFPDLSAQAQPIGRGDARAHLAGLYVDSLGVADEAGLARLFGWKAADVAKALAMLKDRRRICQVSLENQTKWASAKLGPG